MDWQNKVGELEKELISLDEQLVNSINQLSNDEQIALFRRQNELKDIVSQYQEWKTSQKELSDAEKLLDDTNAEVRDMAQSEIDSLKQKIDQLELSIQSALSPKDPDDKKDAIVEIRPGTGGDEAALFVGDLLKMYLRFAEQQGLKSELMNSSGLEEGGFREAIVRISGNGTYGKFKFESGVHRVQRVPVTEAKGRVHTSTATVAVFPVAEESDLEIIPEDLKIETYRSGGHGGQSVNTTDSAVRITHLPTGTVVTMQDERSQLQNKQKALAILRSRVLAAEKEKKIKQMSSARKEQIGSGDRSEKVRTYNFPQDRLTDHRINQNWHNLPGIMNGDMGDIVQQLQLAWQNQQN